MFQKENNIDRRILAIDLLSLSNVIGTSLLVLVSSMVYENQYLQKLTSAQIRESSYLPFTHLFLPFRCVW